MSLSRFLEYRRFVDEPEREQEDGNAGYLGNDFGHFIVRDSLALDVIRQTDLAESRELGPYGLKKPAAAFSPF